MSKTNDLKITIIGCGWLGLPLGVELEKQGHDVAGSTKTKEKQELLEANGIHSFHYDFEENSKVPLRIAKSTEVLIISVPPIRKKEPDFYGNALKALITQFLNTKHVIFTSSIGIYPQQSSIFFENFEFLEMEKNTSLYKAEETLTSLVKSKLTILRLAGLFGNGRHPVKHLQGKNDVKNPFGLVNLVHHADVIRCILRCLESENANGVFNVVYPEHPWRKEYYTKLYRQHDLKAINFALTPTIERRINTTKVREELDFSFEHSIYDLSDCLID